MMFGGEDDFRDTENDEAPTSRTATAWFIIIRVLILVSGIAFSILTAGRF